LPAKSVNLPLYFAVRCSIVGFRPTSGGKLIFHIFASLAEFERDLIRERTKAGLAAARARGRRGGRPKGVDQKKRKAALALKKDMTHRVHEICEIVGISRNTYYKCTRSDDPGTT
jgi:DNA invertase Pin-like site-specific DNA recombinase